MIESGTRDELLAGAQSRAPELGSVLRAARAACPGPKGAILDYQAAALYLLAKAYPTGRILEIGTLRGFSAAVLSQAAPKAEIITLNPNAREAETARQNLRGFPNVKVVDERSWAYLALGYGPYDLIFVDGDHNQINRDLPWFNRLTPGGLICFHDYSPTGSASPSPIVFEALNRAAERLGGFDVKVVDDLGVGFAGFYRRDGETL